MQYTQKELAKLIEDVEKEFTVQLNKAEEDHKSKLAKSEGAESSAVLAKAEEKPEDKKEEKPSEDKKEAKPEDKAEHKEEKEEAPAEAKPEDKEAAAPEHKEEAGKEESAPAESDGCDYDEEDLEHMHKMYMSMNKGELKAHHDSVRKALDSQGMQKCGDMHMSKSETNVTADTKNIEVKAEDIKTNPELDLAKSEAAAYKAKAEDLKKNLDAVQEFLTKLVKKVPQGKAITSLEQITKSESSAEEKVLSKGEVDSILNKKAADPTLAKSDREAINAFYLNGANINTINHLLK